MAPGAQEAPAVTDFKLARVEHLLKEHQAAIRQAT